MENEYRTSAFYLAGFLLARGVPMARFERDYSGRTEFVFKETSERAGLVEQFMLGGGAPVDVHQFIAAIKRLKGVIYDG